MVMLLVPDLVRFRILRHPCPDKLVGIQRVGDVLVPGVHLGGKQRFYIAVLEDVPVGRDDDEPEHFLLLDGSNAVADLGDLLAGGVGSKHDFAALQIPIRRAVLRLDNTCLDNVRHQRAGSDEVRYDLTVCRDGSFIGAVVAVMGKAQAAHIPTPDIYGFINGGSVQNEQLITKTSG